MKGQELASAHGWRSGDAEELHDYAEGVLVGTRHRTSPDPFGMLAIHQWREEEAARSDEVPDQPLGIAGYRTPTQ